MALLVSTAPMITLSPGSVRTISEAPPAASVDGNTNICFFQSRSVIDTISSHSTNVLSFLQLLHNFVFVLYKKHENVFKINNKSLSLFENSKTL